MYSLGVETPKSFQYDQDGFEKAPVQINGDGDGTVNDMSLQLCDQWTSSGVQTRSAKVMRFSNITHSGMLTDDNVLKALMSELGLPSTPQMDLIV